MIQKYILPLCLALGIFFIVGYFVRYNKNKIQANPSGVILDARTHPNIDYVDSSKGAPTKPSLIRKVEWPEYLAYNVYTYFGNGTTTYQNLCGGPVEIADSEIQYADLLGDGNEEAVIATHSCLSNTAGYDVFGVFRIGKNGDVEELLFNDNAGDDDYLGTSTVIGKVSVGIEEYQGKQVIVLVGQDGPLGNAGENTIENRYAWDGKRFLRIK